MRETPVTSPGLFGDRRFSGVVVEVTDINGRERKLEKVGARENSIIWTVGCDDGVAGGSGLRFELNRWFV
jgi:hypothetical protein